MHYRFSDLNGMDIEARDGRIGDVHDLLFDDRAWTLRYLVVDTGGLLSGRKVLIDPRAISGVKPADDEIVVDLNCAQIKESPGIDLDPPVSRQKDAELRASRSWAWYWDGYPVGLGGGAILDPPANTDVDAVGAAKQTDGDPHLRSAREVKGYRIGARDGEIGQVHDMLFNSEDWVLRYLVVDTRVWLPGRKVIVSPHWVDSVDWAQRELVVDLTKDQIKDSPEYDPDADLKRDYEKQLYEHYRRGGYWESVHPATRAAGGLRG